MDKKRLQDILFRFVINDCGTDEFQAKLYSSIELENTDEDLYLELISLDYRKIKDVVTAKGIVRDIYQNYYDTNIDWKNLDLSYQSWLNYVFGAPKVEFLPDLDLDAISVGEIRSLAYTERVFRSAETDLKNYTDAQISQGLQFLMNPMVSENAVFIINKISPSDLQKSVIESIYEFYNRYVAERERSRQVLSEDLRGAIYMWWDIFPTWGCGQESKEMHSLILDLLGRILDIDCSLCRKSAFHGLSHWQPNYPEIVINTISRFIESNNISDELLENAIAAKKGLIQ